MGQDSKIEWTHHTFNPWRGCTKVSAGCANCYADKQAKRNPGVLGIWGANGTRVVASESYWKQPIAWNAAAAAAGERHRVFCASMADVFEGEDTMPAASIVPVNDARARLFDLIDKTPNLDWLLLTKRPECIAYIMKTVGNPGAKNVWIGTSVEDQKTADERIPHLLKVPAAVRFLSMEPLLGPIDLNIDGDYSDWACHHCKSRNVDTEVCVAENDVSTYHCLDCDHFGDGEDADWTSLIDWIIVGGESQAGARPMHPDWARSIRDQCKAAGVPFFFKQWGEWAPLQHHPNEGGPLDRVQFWDEEFRKWQTGIRTFAQHVVRVGKSAAGRLLDGVEHNGMPEVAR